MQTFLPYPDFAESALVLDYRRLGKQRLEVLQLLVATSENGEKINGWRNHPAARMWKEYRPALAMYGVIICQEWIQRGYKDQLLPQIAAFYLPHVDSVVYPAWLGDPEFHAAHRSNLLRKDYHYYSQFGWKESMELPYIWPV